MPPPKVSDRVSIPKPEQQAWGLWASLAWYVLIFEIAPRLYDTLVTATGFGDLEAHSMALHAVNIVISWAKSFMILACAVWLTGIPLRRYLGWSCPRPIDIILGIPVILVVNELSDLLAGSLTANVADYRAAVAEGISPWWYALRPWPAMIFAPVLEESFFRGFLWIGAQSRIGTWRTLVVTSAMFAVSHNYWYQSGIVDWYILAALLVSGLAFGWLRWRSGGTLAPMIGHAVVNAVEAPIAIALSAMIA